MNKVTKKFTCKYCGKSIEIEFNPKDMQDYQKGKLAQLAFPYLTPEKREMIISNTCNECWSKIMKCD